MFDLQNACVIIAQAYPDGGEFLRCAFIERCDVCERQALGSYGDASACTTWAIGTAGCATVPGQREGRRQVLSRTRAAMLSSTPAQKADGNGAAQRF
jgi:hypothetical protein